MKRILGSALLGAAVLTSGCDVSAIFPTAGTAIDRPTGQWQKTVIVLQKYATVAFKDKNSGKILTPEAAQAMPEADVELEAGDFEELTYAEGRLRYAAFGHANEAQPYVIERTMTEAAFESLDEALYKDKYFTFDRKNWDARTRLPLYFLRYAQNGKGHEASFTPSLAKLPNTNRLLGVYLKEFSGEEKLKAGVSQTVYYLGASEGTLKVSISLQKADEAGEVLDTPVKLKSASYDLGSGYRAATLTTEAGGTTFTLPQPARGDKGAFQLMGLRLSAEGELGDWDTLIPIRLKK